MTSVAKEEGQVVCSFGTIPCPFPSCESQEASQNISYGHNIKYVSTHCYRCGRHHNATIGIDRPDRTMRIVPESDWQRRIKQVMEEG